MWYDTDRWARTSRATKTLNFFWIAACAFLWVLVGIRIHQDYQLLAASRLTESISSIIGSIIAVLAFLQMAFQRQEMTYLIRAVDAKFLRVPKDTVRQQKWWKESKQMHTIQGYLLFLSMASGFLLGFSQLLYMAYTGNFFYEAVVIVSDESYSFPWWMQSLYQSAILMYSGVYCSAYNFLLIGLFYHVSRLFKVQEDAILELCAEADFDPEVELLKLKSALRETSEIHE